MRLLAPLLLALSACAVHVDASGGQWACGDDRACPPGTTCFQNLCVRDIPGEFDAGHADAAQCPGYPELVLADHPVQYLRFDDGGGSVARDLGPGAHDGIYVGEPLHSVPGGVVGDADPAVELDGLLHPDTYVRFEGVPDSWSGDFTVEVLVRPMAPQTYGGLFIAEQYMVSGFRLTIGDDGRLQVVCDQSGCATPRLTGPPLAYLVWQHVALVHAADTFVVYVDGVQQAMVTFPDLVPPQPGGWWGPAEGLPTRVQLDEGAIYDRALPPDRIALHARRALEGCP